MGRRSRTEPPPTPTGSAYSAALRLLGRRDYTTQEVRTRLADKGYPEEDVATAIARLTDRRFLDDRRVATAHVRTATSIKGRGRHRIKQELIARGIAAPIVNEAMAALPVEDDGAAVEAFLERRRVAKKLTREEYRRVFQQLMRRGFPSDAIGAALRKRGKAPESDE